ncbi:MAG: peptidylprolyl isomerase [Leucobacter sp.]
MLRRLVPATAAAGLLIAGLTGCTAQHTTASDCTPMQPGAVSENTRVSGEPGSVPTVVIPEKLSIGATQRTVLVEGDEDGRVAEEQSLVGATLALFDSVTGKQLYLSTAPETLLVSEESPNPLSEALRCSVPGDRVVVAVSPEEGESFAAQLGGAAGSSIVGVLDVDSVSPPYAQGRERGLPSGFPAVVTDANGQAGVVLPPREAPAGTTSAVRIEGDGREVAAENNVIGKVLLVNWDGEEEFNGMTELGTEDQGVSFRAELTGKPIGSQVVVIENTEEGAKVAVVDILGAN